MENESRTLAGDSAPPSVGGSTILRPMRVLPRLHYAWIVAGVTFLCLLVSAGIRSVPGVLIVPLDKEFGWGRAAISLAVSINLVLYGAFAPFGAALMDRLGARRVMLGALALLAVGVALTTLIRAPWQLDLLWGVVVGVATGSTASVLGAWVATRWFVAHRGLVLGLLTASWATGQLLFLPVLARLVIGAGWRSAALVIALAAAAIIPIVAIFMRNDPGDVGMRPLGAAAGDSPVPRAGGGVPRAAFAALARGTRSKDFWLLGGSFFICGASTTGVIGTHFIPACIDYGISGVTAAGLLAGMGVLDLGGTTVSGWLSDRWNSRSLLCWYYGLRGLSLIFLPFAFGAQLLLLPNALGSNLFGSVSAGLVVFAIFYGLDWVATVPPTVKLTADLFGRREAAVMFAWIFAAHQLGAATAAYGAGAIRASTGAYQIAFVGSGVLCLLASALVLRIGHPKHADPARSVPAEIPQPV